MLQWASVIVCPVVFLTNLSLVYMLVPLACQTQRTFPLHVSNGVSLAFAVITSWLAWRAVRKVHMSTFPREDDTPNRPFLLHLGLGISALCALAIALQWSTQLLLSPCHG